MVYNIVMLVLILGVIGGALYLSEKIARGPVRYVGMVRSWPDADAKSTHDAKDMLSELQRVKIFVQRDFDEDDKVLLKRLWRCERCGFIQSGDKSDPCRHCAQNSTSKTEPRRTKEQSDLSLEHQVETHGKVLDKHHEMIANLEIKIRKLQAESLTDAREIQQETPALITEDYRN